MSPLRQKLPPGEAGFALIEVVVSAAVLLVASAGTFGLLNAMTKSSGEQRHRSQAYALAQEDQARLRSIKLTALNRLDEPREVPVDGTMFTVRSTGEFINNKTATVSCVEGEDSADYAQVTTTVTWPGMQSGEKTVLRSIVSPSSGSMDDSHSTLTVAIKNEKGEPRAGVDLKVGTFVGTTNDQGCATFPDLAQGNHMLTSLGEDVEMVSPNSNFVEETLVGVPIGNPKLVPLTYDYKGAVPVKFIYRVGTEAKFEPTAVDSLVAMHSVMKGAKVFGTAGGLRQPSIEAKDLFPFSSPYSLYAGSCDKNNPGVGAGLANVVIPAGGTLAPVTLQVPAVDVTVKNGSTLIQGAKVTLTDLNCKDSKGALIKRTYTTNASGKQSFTTTGLIEPSIPWGSYEVCASAKISTSIRSRKVTLPTLSLAKTTAAVIDLSGSGAGSSECP